MSLAEASGAGRARSALDTTGNAPPRAKRQRWQPAPVATPEEVNFHHPKLREYLGNLLNEEAGPFAHVDGDARKLIKELLHCRNPETGKCCPSWPYLARAIGDCDRNVGYILGRLDSGPSRQSDKRIVEGHGLIWRRGGRCGFRRLPTQYGITCRFLVLAGLVLPHNCMECRCGIAWGAEERGSISSGSSGSSSLNKSSKNGGEHRRFRAVTPSSKRAAAEKSDPVLDAFVAVFEQHRKAKYGDDDHGGLREENRVKLRDYLADLVGGAWAWSEQEGMNREHSDVARGLFEGLVRLWLDWPGSRGLLRERHHPIGLLIDDLEKFGSLARAAWKRAQRKPKPLEAHEAPEGSVSLSGYVEQLQAREPETWPELDASEPDADELAELAALAKLQAQEPERSATAEADELAPAVDPVVLAQVRRALEEREQIAAKAAHSRALLEALYPPADAAGLAAPLGAVELGFDAGEAGLRGLDLAGEQEQRRDGIGDHHPRGANGDERGIKEEVRTGDDVPPSLGGGGGPGHSGIEGSEAGVGEADRNVVVRDGAAIGLPGASHEATVPRSAGELAPGGIGVSREVRARAPSRGVRVTRQTPRPLSLSEFRERAEEREKAAKGAGFSVSRESPPPLSVQEVRALGSQALERLGGWATGLLEQPFPRVSLEERGSANVAAQDLGGAVSALLLDRPLGAAGERGASDEPGSQRVPGEERGIEPDRGRAALKDPRDIPRGQPMRRYGAPARAAEQRAGGEPRALDPRLDRGDRTRAGAASEDRQLDAGPLLIGLRDPEGEHEAAGDGAQIGEVDRHQLRTAERAGPAEQEQGPIARVAEPVTTPAGEGAEIIGEEGIDATRGGS
jgi:hypothetical protein